ncbi:MAG TPA: cell division protein FtsZ [Polyangiaceae bacterium]|nr:MAG: Cell division protein FtsZ [Deltaproteobacteria bacterium ADurb.Bin207]HNS99227.1 cell division protein FtsZ [Polyangiaceae bacterium]HNZ23655.1 cell division protein FtsZ [Polyangiaceae bacterium]HOD22429.1 cell division protein FtsZ [Polyangiaceae bacterium]HOE47800.1 cell division protein FtsZ [Polyangiaceae bacterium]
MTFSIEFADDSNNEYQANIKVVGIGGSGGNAVNTMISFGLEGVEFIVANTDAQALNASAAPVKLPIGQTITRGLGAGANPEKGRKAALEDVTQIKQFLQGADMVFITAGMGGGTGTGAAPIIAQIAREEGALCVGVVTRPFAFEGKQRARIAEAGLNELASQVDSLITIPNQKLLTFSDEDLSFTEAFRRADEVLYQAVKGISDLIQLNGVVNVDFADVKTIMSNRGRAIMGTGCAKGDGRAALATHMAISSPLLDNISVEGATAVLVNIVGGSTLKIKEMEEATEIVYEQAHEDANIIWGASVDESMGDMIKVTVIATGFGQYAEEVVREQESQRPTMVAVPQQVATSRVAPQGMPSRAAIDTRFHPAASTSSRAPAPASSAPAPAPVSRHPRSTFAPNADLDWDAPAFSRHSGEYPPR